MRIFATFCYLLSNFDLRLRHLFNEIDIFVYYHILEADSQLSAQNNMNSKERKKYDNDLSLFLRFKSP